MSERDQAGFPPPGPPKRTVYTAGKVPGVHYVDGVAHSPPDPRPAAPPPPPPPPPQRPIRPPAARRPPAGPPRDTRPAKERRARPLRWIGGIFVILLVGLLVLGWLVWARIDKVDAIPDDHGSAVSEGQVYLLVGSDSREDLSDDERSDLGTGSVSGQRTDTIMLLYVPTSGRRALISIPRDSLVDIPGHDRQRINAAFAYGGPRLLVETIEQNTGVAIDDYVQIGLGGFAGMVDALGGVDVCLDEAIQDDKAHIDLPAGCQTLNGPDALGYARARYFDPRGDIGRVERQQEVLGAIASKTMSPGTLLNPVKLTRVGLAGGDALTVDDGSNPISVARFAWTLMRVTGGGGDKLTVPLGDVGNTVSWHSEDAPRLWAALQAGEEVPPDLVRQE
ncbi:MAG TPA: LCP family protein [Jiangellaceae bacterium]|nr:LCP family protein [Jiangellaceae bacterium]